MAKIKQKEAAIELRTSGMSIKEISNIIKVSPSTVSVWCRDISLNTKAIERISQNGKSKSIIGLMNYSEKKRAERQLAEKISAQTGKQRLGSVTKRDIYCIGLGLYWGEGYKSGSQEFGFTNSDPAMIVFYIKWLDCVFSINSNRLILRVSINSIHKKREPEILGYWSKLTTIPKNQFTKTSFIKTKVKKIYPNESTHMGTLRIKVKNGTALRREVLGAIRSIS